ncbi:hypothetical protein ACFQL9_13435 [Halobaculum lipolyticum]|uniref:Uncharacterized protein n=2 Tax=Halobaculum lipolyticum TaxID=3032001 RepID=A0ABD5WH39_9EURY
MTDEPRNVTDRNSSVNGRPRPAPAPLLPDTPVPHEDVQIPSSVATVRVRVLHLEQVGQLPRPDLARVVDHVLQQSMRRVQPFDVVPPDRLHRRFADVGDQRRGDPLVASLPLDVGLSEDRNRLASVPGSGVRDQLQRPVRDPRQVARVDARLEDVDEFRLTVPLEFDVRAGPES